MFSISKVSPTVLHFATACVGGKISQTDGWCDYLCRVSSICRLVILGLCRLIEGMGRWTGLGYNLLNILIKTNAVRGNFKLPVTYGKIKLQRGDNRVRKSAIE